MRPILSAILFLTATMGANAITWDFGNFDTEKKECTLTRCGGNVVSTTLTIPASYKHTDGNYYTVVAIAPHAIENISKITEICIPSTIISIGETREGETGELLNFANCTALQKFTVYDDNKVFSSIDGLLYLGDKSLMAVPKMVAVTSSGSFTVPAQTQYIAASAFADNSTISSLTLPAGCTIERNGGLNLANKIAFYYLSGTGSTLSTSDRMLIADGNRVVSFPRRGTPYKNYTATMPPTVTEIEEYAFANTEYVNYIELGSVEKIGRMAFADSNLKNITLPASVTEIGTGALSNCLDITTIRLKMAEPVIPAEFAYNCRTLYTVATDHPIKSIGKSAFQKCSKLDSFPFSGYTDIAGDAAFASTGFTTVTYNDDFTAAGHANSAPELFSNCSSLTKIDASAVRGTQDNPFVISPSFVESAKMVHTIKLPAFSRLEDPEQTAFFRTNPTHIEIGTIWASSPGPQFWYDYLGSRIIQPKVYVAVTANSKYFPETYNTWEIGSMFKADDPVTLLPQIFCDPYTPSANYVCPDATYYVPGGTEGNYSAAAEAGCQVIANYTIAFGKDADNGMTVTLGQMNPVSAKVNDFAVTFNDSDPIAVGQQGTAESSACGLMYGDVDNVTVSYTVNGVAMSTAYPVTHWDTTSVDDITAGAADTCVNGRNINCGADCKRFAVCNATGMEVWRQEGAQATLDTLVPGVYIARITTVQGTERTFKFILR